MRDGPRVEYDAIAEALSPDQLARALGAEKIGNGWRCPAPDHPDDDPSFSLFRDGGRTAGKCHGCGLSGSPVTLASRVWGVTMPEAAERLVSELGLHVATGNGEGLGARWGQEDAARALHRRGLRPETIERFRITADLRRQAWRFPVPGGADRLKRFGPGKPKAWWEPGKPDHGADLYGLGGVSDESTWLLLVEGEPDVWIGQQAGLPAVTFTGGATTVPGSGVRALAEDGRPVTVLYDADDQGREGGRKAARALREAGVEVVVRKYVDLPPGGDLTDLYGKLGRDDTELREAVALLPMVADDPDDDAAADVTPDRAFPLLSELLDHPELLEPPEEVVPRLAWRGRTSGLVGPDKSGKSTMAAHAVVALSRGARWLGERVAHGRAVIAAPDEAVGDTVRRLHELGADPSLVRVLALRPPDLLASLEGLLEAHPADLVVVDSLAEWARLTLGTAPEDGDAAGWGAVVRPLVHVSRAHECAVLLLHHPRRSDGQYRGSLEIAAALDCLLEMRTGQQGEDPTLRRITGRARWPVEDYSVRMDGDEYVLGAGGPIPMDARVLMDARANPGTSRADSYDRLGGRKQSHSAAVNRLVESGGLVDRGGSLFHPDHVEEDLL